MPSVFLSFLGTNRYISCNYSYAGKETITGVHFIQEALVRMFCNDFGPGDRIVIFLTRDARNRNWEPCPDPAEPSGKFSARWMKLFSGSKRKTENNYPGLKACLAPWVSHTSLIEKDIPDGLNEQEIWAIFNAVYEQVPEQAEVYLDITHAYRSIPMLATVLLNYLYVVKNISVKGIFYGAFETLGSVRMAEKIPLEKRTAPVINLLPFYELHRWSNAAHAFVFYGISGEMAKLVRENVWQRKDEGLNYLTRFANYLTEVSGAFTTLRGQKIVDGTAFETLQQTLSVLKQEKGLEPLSPLLEVIAQKISPFDKNNIHNGLHAIAWCIEHNLIQQAVTLIQEVTITWLCQQFSQQYSLSYKIQKDRELVNQAFNILSQPNRKELQTNKKAVRLSSEELLRQFHPVYNSMRNLRNSINHGGYTDRIEAGRFHDKIKNAYQNLKSLIEKYEDPVASDQ